MADHHAPTTPDNDYAEHERTYYLFTNYLVKWGSIITIFVLLFAGSMTGLVPWALTLLLVALLLAVGTQM